MNPNLLANQGYPQPPLIKKPRARSVWKILAALVAITLLLAIAAIAFLIVQGGSSKSNSRRFANTRPPAGQFAPGVVSPGREKKVQPSEKQKPVGPQAVAPRFSMPGGVYTNSFSVELKAKSPHAVIRYTTDGSEPTSDSPAYAEPVVIANTTLLRAACFEPELAPSPTATQTYTMLDDNVRQFSSNLPLVILNPFGQRIQTESYVPVSARFIHLSGERSTLAGPADFDGRGEVKRRGYSSLRYPKASFTFKIREDGEKKKSAIFGMPADSDWVLYAPYSDKTLMRDVLAYELSNQMGRYAPRTRFVEVFLSRPGGKLTTRDYLGVYVLEEKIGRGKNRVNVTKLGPDDNQEPEISGGYIFKRDHSGPPGGNYRNSRNRPREADEEGGFYTSRGLQLFYVDPEEDELTKQQKNWLYRYVDSFERALHGSNFKSPTDGYAKYLDVDSFIDQFWITEMSKNIDAFRYSCFMTKDRGGKIKLEPLWDWNLSFGNANYYDAWETDGWYYPRLRETEVCWFRRLVEDPDFEQKHIDRWAELRQDLFAPERLLRRMDELAALLQEAQARNYQRWPILGRSVHPNWYVGRTYADEVNWMKNWTKERIAWIDQQFPAAPTFSEKAGQVSAGTKLNLRASAGKVYYTLNGSDPRLPGGEASKQARAYGSPIVLAQSAQVMARARRGDNWSAPAVAKFTVAGKASP